MNRTTPPTPLDALTDPRTAPDFCAQYLPLVNGQQPPNPPVSGKHEAIMLAFAAAYYAINRQYACLVQLRRELASSAPLRERAQLREIDHALRARDELEDEHAPYGVRVEPVMKDGFAVNLVCSFGTGDPHGGAREDLITLTASVPVPLPDGAKLQDYLTSVQIPEFFQPRN